MHPSRVTDRTQSYERLEFLGDSILGLWSSRERCSTATRDAAEGKLSQLRSAIVSRRSCAAVAREIGIDRMFAEQFELTDDLRRSDNVLAALIESAIAALVLEHGLDAVAPAVLEAFEGQIDEALHAPGDFKTRLQEEAAKHGRKVTYNVVEVDGPAHARRFTCEALVAGVPRGTRHRPLEEGGPAGGRSRGARVSLGHLEGQSLRLSRDWHWTRPQRPLALAAVYLRAITIRGFKSFPDPVEVRLEPGVAVVVGPNGSGKSNVADALLWASGSLAPSELRAEKPDDVLFAGSAGRQPAAYCEVELRFEDVGGALPGIDFEEVSIARRLHRGGEGQYLVNGATVAGPMSSSSLPTSASAPGRAPSSARARWRRSSRRHPASGARSSRRRPGWDGSSAVATAPS